MSEAKSRIIMKKSWTDPEPDTFTMSLWRGRITKQKFLVVNGNATWLNHKQALEVREFLDECIAELERDEDVSS